MFTGLMTALITPMSATGVDYDSLKRLIDYQLKNGVDALLVLGTTGEPSTLKREEKTEIIEFAVDYIAGAVPLAVGIGSNCTETAVSSAITAKKLGANGLLAVTPYYNKCTQNGLVEYYRAITSATDLPVIAYNVPGRTGVNILPQTAAKIATLKNMGGIKEACGNIAQILETARLIENKMPLISGDDCLALPTFTLGARGLISVASNAAPRLVVDMTHAYLAGNVKKSRELQFKLQPFFNALFDEVSPVPIKYACSLLGLANDFVRAPLMRIEEKNAAPLRLAMEELGLL